MAIATGETPTVQKISGADAARSQPAATGTQPRRVNAGREMTAGDVKTRIPLLSGRDPEARA